MANIKTGESNLDVMNRMEKGFVDNVENVNKNVVDGISKEEMKVIINNINKIRNRKYTTGKDLVNYIFALSDQIKLITA